MIPLCDFLPVPNGLLRLKATRFHYTVPLTVIGIMRQLSFLILTTPGEGVPNLQVLTIDYCMKVLLSLYTASNGITHASDPV